jgi:mono/diheme cytochrome c family protein
MKDRFMFFRFSALVFVGLPLLLVSPHADEALAQATLANQPQLAAKDAVSDTTDQKLAIEKGKYLATAGDCIACHTRPGGEMFAGGVPFKTDFGTIYSANITPAMATGIGKWTKYQFTRAMRKGISADGSHLYPAFPYTAYTKVSDDDIDAIFLYIKTVAPVDYTPPKNQMSFPFNQRALMFFWNKLFLKEGAFKPNNDKSADWNRGAYLVEGLGHCGACHTPRNVIGGEIGDRALSGGAYQDNIIDAVHGPEIVSIDEEMVRKWSTSNLTSSSRGLGAWSTDEIAAYLKTGHNARAGAFGPMAEVIKYSTQHLTDEDLNAMAIYLKSLPPIQQEITKPVSAESMKQGEIAYSARCVSCHQPTGLGTPPTPNADRAHISPPLVGNTVVQAQDPATLINVILYGAHEVVMKENAWPKMPGLELDFGLDDKKIALIASYVRNSWGNKGDAVDPKDVTKQR